LNRRRLRLIVVLLLATSVFVSISSLWTPDVLSAPTLTRFPTHAPPGYGRADNASRVQLSGSGFVSTGSSRNCALYAFGIGTLFDNNPNRTECTISDVGALSAFFSVSSNAGQGSYTLNVTDTRGTSYGSSQRTQTTSFTVDPRPDLVLSVSSGSPGTTVTITSGSHKFAGGISSNPDAGICSISSTASDILASQSCFIDSSGNLYSTQFTVKTGATVGGYQINVTGSHGDFGLSGFTVIGFNLTLSPNRAQPGQVIYVSATGAPPSTSCSLLSDNPNLVKSVSGISSNSIGFVSGSFTVGSSPAAAAKAGGPANQVANNTVTISCGSPARTASANFTVLPKITLSPTAGIANQTITVTGVGFRGDMAICSITGPVVAASPGSSCTVTGSGTLSGQFIVKSGAPDGASNVTAVPNVGFSAIAQFNKVSGPTMFVSPNATPPGYGTQDGTVIISGGGFLTGSSRNCASGLTSSGGGAFFATSPSKTCTIDSSGSLTGSFAVASGISPGLYRINVTDPLTGARVTFSNFNVTPVALIKFSMTTATIGQTVDIANTGAGRFSPFDVGPCTITASPASPALMSMWACTIDSNGNLTAPTFFQVATVSPTTYTVTVTAKHGETASNVFSPAGGPTVTLSPNVVAPSTSGGIPVYVAVQGSGFNPMDVNCTIVFVSNSTNIADNVTCAIMVGNAIGSFRVIPTAPPGTYRVNVTGVPNNDRGSAFLDVAVTGITTTTSTTYSPTITSTFSTTTTTTTTGTSSSLSTTTFQTTGRYTEYYGTYTTTTISAQTTTTASSTLTITSIVTVTTLTFLTTLSTTITHTLGQAIQGLSRSSSSDILALIGLAVVLGPSAFRRLVP
jgi:hypothetical protein